LLTIDEGFVIFLAKCFFIFRL